MKPIIITAIKNELKYRTQDLEKAEGWLKKLNRQFVENNQALETTKADIAQAEQDIADLKEALQVDLSASTAIPPNFPQDRIG